MDKIALVTGSTRALSMCSQSPIHLSDHRVDYSGLVESSNIKAIKSGAL